MPVEPLKALRHLFLMKIYYFLYLAGGGM